MLGKTEGKRRGGRQRMRWLDSISDLMDVNLSKPQEIVKDRGVWCATVHGVTKGWIWQWLNSSNFLDTQRLSSQPYFLSGTAQMKAFFSHHQAWGNSHVSSIFDHHWPWANTQVSYTFSHHQAWGNTRVSSIFRVPPRTSTSPLVPVEERLNLTLAAEYRCPDHSWNSWVCFSF